MTNSPALLTGGGRWNLISVLLKKAGETEHERFRRESAEVTAALAKRFAFGASGSLRAETVSSLMQSVVYCAERRLKGLQEAEALAMLGDTGFAVLYEQGRALVQLDVQAAKKLLDAAQNLALKGISRALDDTLWQGIPAFFTAYDVDFAAHETQGSIDYQLYSKDAALTGAAYILDYLKRLIIELYFTERFDADEVKSLLRSYNADFYELYDNIYERGLANLLGRTLCGMPANSLALEAEDLSRLADTLRGMSEARAKAAIGLASEKVSARLSLSPAERDYALAASREIAARVYEAAKTDSLDTVFIPIIPATAPNPVFRDGAAMEDEALRALIEEMRDCRCFSDKAAIIKRHVKSISDLAELLGAGCFAADEYDMAFGMLGDEALALLLKLAPEDELYATEGEAEWHRALVVYIEAQGKAEDIRKLAEGIEWE